MSPGVDSADKLSVVAIVLVGDHNDCSLRARRGFGNG
jgi:hypothetical protein